LHDALEALRQLVRTIALEPFRLDQPGEVECADAFGADMLKLCVEVGGVLTGGSRSAA